MRKLIVCNIMSLDGYYEGLGNNVIDLFEYRREAYPMDESFDLYNAERLRTAGTLLLGRLSYTGFQAYWPSVVDDPTVPIVQHEISRLNNAIDKVVVSDTLTTDETAPWHHNTRTIRRANAYEQIADLKSESGGDILVFGSRTLWNNLLPYGLVDELHLMICPVVLSAGTRLFSGKPPVALRLLSTRTWEDSGNTLVQYSVKTQDTSAV